MIIQSVVVVPVYLRARQRDEEQVRERWWIGRHGRMRVLRPFCTFILKHLRSFLFCHAIIIVLSICEGDLYI